MKQFFKKELTFMYILFNYFRMKGPSIFMGRRNPVGKESCKN